MVGDKAKKEKRRRREERRKEERKLGYSDHASGERRTTGYSQ